MSTTPYILYGAPVSLYTGKSRAFMRKSGLPFRERLPSDPRYTSEILAKIGRFWLPVLEAPDGTLVQDTTEIVDFIESREPDVLTCYPASPRQAIAALIIELYGDEGLVRQAMHYRWNFLEENGRFLAGNIGRMFNAQADIEEARVMAAGPMQHLSGYLPGIGITTETIPVVEAQYMDLLAVLDEHFLRHPYLFGGRPSIGDYGLMGPLYAHLGRDPYPAFLMARHADRLQRWVERMNTIEVDTPEFPGLAPDFLAGDEIPETLKALLRLIARDYLPEVVATIDAVNGWLAGNAVDEGALIFPRGKRGSLGSIAPVIRGVAHPQAMRHYALWMVQRVTDAYDRLAPAARIPVDALLAETGLEALVRHRAHRRIERRDYVEVWGPALAKAA
ncbi:MAG: glutathione S-transferase N-terminal domain-containing protein [Zavarzinia sp.]|nr:glutathione S-transferase N-terminal domain-containing protein [Zavarzinia sp.]